ncbi:MAG: carboxypeptidase regulatory-like domain-containing protein [Flavobacteriales bacterium]|nr:carboxypeptidase regulatory-like domain-containing protein [Flavobacteriales bacterium]MBK7482755.1 carboxypeptidase regulatory-like domain-containing protein [Flavobacteriales bacterium]
MTTTNNHSSPQRPSGFGLVLLVLLLLPALLPAQKLKERMADRYSEVFDYPKVAAIYEDLVASGKAEASDMRRLALAYRKMGQPAKAEATYLKLMGTGTQTPDDVFAYAEQLRANGKYPQALEWYATYATLRPEDPRVVGYLNNTAVFDRLMRDSASATVRSLPINSPQADLGPGVMEELLLFASARGDGVGGHRTYAWDDQPFLNLYSALLKGEIAEEPLVMRKDVNSRYHDGVGSFDSTSNRLYFTRNNFYYGSLDKNERGELNLGIFYTDVITGEFGQPEWGSLIPFDHNDPEYNYGHPSISPNGAKLFFVSDRPGGHGGTDVWYCEKLGSQWGAPINMGPEVNSAGNEMFPYLHRDSTLYFASSGHAGLGGLDLFYARLTKAGPGRVFNMGYPMNTRFNDHGLVFINDTTGFFVSDREGGQGSDDIYGCTVRPPTVYIAGVVVDEESRVPIDGATLVMKDEAGRYIENFKVESQPGGKFNIEVPYKDKYVLVANKNGYFQKELTLSTNDDPLEQIVVEMLKYDYAAEGFVFHGETGAPLAGATVTLTDGKDNVLETITTDASGKYAFPLKPESDYRIKAEKEAFFKQSARITTKGKPSEVIRTDFKLFPLVVDQVVRLENIFYDYNKWNIRPDAAVELDKLVATLQDNPTVKIELSSHTDCRGKDAYNMSLSEKRAKSAVDYIISNGIPKDNITSKGYGESQPSETCECTKCTEDEHQRNRRTEFKVLSK